MNPELKAAIVELLEISDDVLKPDSNATFHACALRNLKMATKRLREILLRNEGESTDIIQ